MKSGCEGRNRTCNSQLMGLISYRCLTPLYIIPVIKQIFKNTQRENIFQLQEIKNLIYHNVIHGILAVFIKNHHGLTGL